MSELSDALRQFADRIDQGLILKDATDAVIVLADGLGQSNATYIGRLVPANKAGIHLLARGIQNFNETAAGPMAMSATRGSTH